MYVMVGPMTLWVVIKKNQQLDDSSVRFAYVHGTFSYYDQKMLPF